MSASDAVEYALLGLVLEQPMHGYELMQHYDDGALAQLFHLEMSHLYSLLKRLEGASLIEHELQARGAKPPRKVYRATSKGEAEFSTWLTSAVPRIRDIRIEFMLKLFFARRAAPESLGRLLERQIATCREDLETVDGELVTEADDFARTLLLVRRRQVAETIAWLQELHETGELATPEPAQVDIR